MTNLIALPAGTILVADFSIERVLGAGGFGITYLARETALDRHVTIKEYFPSDFAARAENNEAAPRSLASEGDYNWGLERFLEEAQTLARFNHPNIVRVYRYFRANNTGYMVLHYEEGASFKGWLKGLNRAPRQPELDRVLAPLLDALDTIHKADFLHRDIAPDNIIIRKDTTPVLIDFGSARGEIAAHSKTVSALVKPGYSPYEQYAERSGQQGPWTDIYALSATLYQAITGKRPPDAPSRMVRDDMVPAREAALSAYRPGFLKAIDRALSLGIEARPQSIAIWKGELLAPEPRGSGLLERKGDKAKGKRGDPAAEPQRRKGSGAGATVPPPPDRPGRQGEMLDFVEGLKNKPGRAAAAAGAAAERAGAAYDAGAMDGTLPLETLLAPPAFLRREASPGSWWNKRSAARRPEPQSAPAPPAAQSPPDTKPKLRVAGAKRYLPRPRPRSRPLWRAAAKMRPVLLKLAIGASVAGLAVAVQDRIPHLERTAPVAASASAAAVPLIGMLKAHTGTVSQVAYSEDGQLIVTAGSDATLRVWDAVQGELKRTIALSDGAATAVAVLGHRALTGHGGGQLVLWNLDQGTSIQRFQRSDANIGSVTFAGTAERFAASGQDLKMALWDSRSQSAPMHVFEGTEASGLTVAYSRHGPYLAAGASDSTVKLWNLDTFEVERTYKGFKEDVTALAFTADGRTLAGGGKDGTIRMWSTATGRLTRLLPGHGAGISGLAFAPAGDVLASAGNDGVVRLYDPRRGRLTRALASHSGVVNALSFSPDGARLASAGDDGAVRVWNGHVAKHE